MKHHIQKTEAPSSEAFTSVTFNGIWCWFSDPRAVYYEGKHKRTYTGWVDNYGDIHVGYYDHDTHRVHSKVIYENLEIDDHNNPSLLFDGTGRLLVFFNAHSIKDKPLYMVKFTTPKSIDTWDSVEELYLNDATTHPKEIISQHTYTNPIKLTSEDDKIYLFWRGINLKPTFASSNDNGATWSKGKILFMPTKAYDTKRPYTKVYSDGNSKIHFAFTDGHPSESKTTALYYMYYEAGNFYKADGTKIKGIDELPVLQSELDVVYTFPTSKVWNWDIAENEKGNPILVYAKFPTDTTHIYCYAVWDNHQWNNYDLINSGGWFPETIQGQKELQSKYSGGITIDHESPNTLYLSVKRDLFFEIEKWVTANDGKSWKVEKITDGSTKNNIRPFAIRGAKKGNPLQVLWIQNTKYIFYAFNDKSVSLNLDFKDRYHSAIKINVPKPVASLEASPKNDVQFMRSLLESQFENPDTTLPYTSWKSGLLYAGAQAFYELTKEERYQNELMNIRQYENDASEEEDAFILKDFLWSYTGEAHREKLQQLENVNVEDFKNFKKPFELATLARILTKYKEQIFDKSSFEKRLQELALTYLNERLENNLWFTKTDDASVYILKNAFVLYGIAKGIRLGLIDTKWEQTILNVWNALRSELIKDLKLKNTSSLDMQTTGIILLAGKEITAFYIGRL